MKQRLINKAQWAKAGLIRRCFVARKIHFRAVLSLGKVMGMSDQNATLLSGLDQATLTPLVRQAQKSETF